MTVARWSAVTALGLVGVASGWDALHGTAPALAMPSGSAVLLGSLAVAVFAIPGGRLTLAVSATGVSVALSLLAVTANAVLAAGLDLPGAAAIGRLSGVGGWPPPGQAAGVHLLLALALVATLRPGPVLGFVRVAGLVAGMLAPAVSMSAHAAGGEGYTFIPGLAPMSGPVALTTIVVTFGVVAAAPTHWPLRTLIQRPGDRVMVGHLLPFVVVIPVLGPVVLTVARSLGADDRLQTVLATVLPTLALLGLLAVAVRDHRRLTSEVEARDSQLLTILDGLPIAVMLRAHDGTLLHRNPEAERFVARMGVDASAVQDSATSLMDHVEVVDEHGRPYAAEDLPVVSAIRDGRRHDATVGYILRDGTQAWYSVRAAPVPLSDGTSGTVVTLDEVTEQHVARSRVALAERSLRLTFEHAPIGMALISPEGRLLQVNAALCALLGYEDANPLLTGGLESATHPDEREVHGRMLSAWLAGTRDRYRVDRRLRHVEGHAIVTQMSIALVRDDDGTPLHLIAQVVDLTERRALERELRLAAVHDPLTGLVNRRALVERLSTAQHRRRRQGDEIGMLFIDLDDFKEVNDAYGHEAGDRLLIEVGRRLLAVTRRSDTVCRLGGDEFVVLCAPIEGPGDLAELVDRLEGMRASVMVDEVGVSVGQSVGAIMVEPDEELEAAMRRADAEMYRTKRRRRGATPAAR